VSRPPRRPYGRTWTLAELDRGTAYRLWYDPEVNRWEVRSEDQQDGTLVTRLPIPRRTRAPRAQAAEGRWGGGAPGGGIGNADAVPTS
jgi:hypothetical protein